MSQVTRCPSCGTRFKVVADQLRISQGWVRCGRCQSVFDASEDLQTVADEALHATVDASQNEKPNSSEDSVAPDSGAVGDDSAGEREVTAETAQDEEATQPEEPESSSAETLADDAKSDKDVDAEVEAPSAEPAPVQDGDAQKPEPHLGADDGLLSAGIDDVRREVDAEQPLWKEESEAASAAVDEPGFVRQARRKAFWHSTGMRVALLLGSALAVAGVAGQYAWHQRDALAVQYPAVAPVLLQVCERVGCKLGARREIADVVISGSGFKQLADANQYQWSLTLENRSDVPVATPVAELTLTDAQDKPLLRRVVDLQTLGAPAQLQARQEWSVNVPVQVQELSAPVSGYRALVFYP